MENNKSRAGNFIEVYHVKSDRATVFVNLGTIEGKVVTTLAVIGLCWSASKVVKAFKTITKKRSKNNHE